MPLVITEYGCVRVLNRQIFGGVFVLSFGLFRNNLVPSHSTTIADLTVCNFSGYAGLQVPSGYSPPVWDGVQAVSYGNALTWTHDAGPTPNAVYGYYIVDALGNLIALELNPNGPTLLALNGDTLRVIPVFTFRSRF